MRSTMQRLAVVSFLVTALQLTGCQYRSKSDTYYMVASNINLPYWQAVQEGFKHAGKEYAVTTYITGPEKYDPQAEVDAFEKAIASKPAGILISVADAAALRNDIGSAISSGIPVITVDSDAPQSARLYFIGTNNLEVGHLGGKRLVEQLHGKGKVVFYSIVGQPNIEDRLRGYTEILSESPGIKIADVVNTGGDSNAAFDRTEQYVKRTGAEKIDAFVSLESSSGPAIAEVLKRNNATDRLLIAMDADPETLKLIDEGKIDSTISQKPFTMGYLGLKALDEAHHSQKALKSSYTTDPQSPFPTFVDTGSALITKLNVSTLLSQAK